LSSFAIVVMPRPRLTLDDATHDGGLGLVDAAYANRETDLMFSI